MEFKYSLPTKILFGENCIKNHKEEILKFGKKAFIVTGNSSGKLSGALNDIISVLDDYDIDYLIFDKVLNNPTLENVALGSEKAVDFCADFIIGIGGGSPIDAAKAIAVLAANDIKPLDLFTNEFKNKPLPIIAIPTTAGTGSEVTSYSILTRKDIETKRSFGNDDTFPKLAIMDPAYTMSLNREVTINTAVDAFSHGVESYLSKRSTCVSDIFARQCIIEFASALQALKSDNIDYETRSKLLYCSMLGGMAISHTGTTIVHAMGYSLTYFRGIPHGKANGLLMKEFFKFNYSICKAKIDDILSIMNMSDINEFGKVMADLLNSNLTFSKDELLNYSGMAMDQKSVLNNAIQVTKEDLFDILKNSLL
jgi:alcohol dehydrogenase class IV